MGYRNTALFICLITLSVTSVCLLWSSLSLGALFLVDPADCYINSKYQWPSTASQSQYGFLSAKNSTNWFYNQWIITLNDGVCPVDEATTETKFIRRQLMDGIHTHQPNEISNFRVSSHSSSSSRRKSTKTYYHQCLGFKKSNIWKVIDSENNAAGVLSNFVDSVERLKSVKTYILIAAILITAATGLIILFPFFPACMFSYLEGSNPLWNVMGFLWTVSYLASWSLTLISFLTIYNNKANGIGESKFWAATFFGKSCNGLTIENGDIYAILISELVIAGLVIFPVVVIELTYLFTYFCVPTPDINSSQLGLTGGVFFGVSSKLHSFKPKSTVREEDSMSSGPLLRQYGS